MEYLRHDSPDVSQETYSGKKQVWIESEEEGYEAATVLEDKGDSLLVQKTSSMEEITINKDDAQHMNSSKFDKLEDMASLTYLSEASVLHNLKSRYYSTMIYTYSGIFCIAVNPYARLPIYTKEVIQSYRGKRRTEMPPHIFTVADEAYQKMIQQRENQSILITGESGAGKTENTKKVIQYFASICGVEKNLEGAGLDEQLVRCNPVLEAFGNAKTIKNDNSSRFGKFIRIHFGAQGKIHSADIERYLLEKARVTYQNPDERSFHIFYQMIKGMDRTEREECLLSSKPEDYKLLSNGDVIVDSLNDANDFIETKQCMGVLNFSEEMRNKIFRFSAGILHLGNIELKANKRDEGCTIDDPTWLEKACHMFGLNTVDMTKALIKPRIKVGSEYVHKGQTAQQVKHSINALCKSVFEKLFKLVLDMCNETLETKLRKNMFIGVLDIAGFEIFEYNSFEQLCINLTNEKIQQFFNHHMFTLEQEEYRKEGIKWEFIDFGLDLEPTIELIEKNMGVFAVMDEECIMPKATDMTFLSKLSNLHQGKNPKYHKPSMKSQMGEKPEHFIIQHYAGKVGYNVDGWLDKNKDPLNENVVELFCKSKEPVFSKMFESPIGEDKNAGGRRKKGGSFQTVAMIHKTAVEHLMSTLRNTSPHFIRCILPNMKKRSGIMEARLVLEQLKCNGVLEGIRIVRKGFPNRLMYQEFVQRYSILAPSAIPQGFMDGKVATQKLVEALALEENAFRMGISKIFLRCGVIGHLEDLRDQRVKTVLIGFQTLARGWLARKKFRKLLDLRVGVLVAQRNTRQYFILRQWQWWRLFTKVKPLLSVSRQEEEIKQKEQEAEAAKVAAEKAKVAADEMIEKMENIQQEAAKVKDALEKEQQAAMEAEEACIKLEGKKNELEDEITNLMDQIEEEQDNNFKISAQKRALEAELQENKGKLDNMEQSIKTKEADLQRKDDAITAKDDELAKKIEEVKRLSDKQKNLESSLSDVEQSMATMTEKANTLDKAKKKLDTEIKRLGDELDSERKSKSALDKALRNKEAELRDTNTKLEEVAAAKADLEASLKKKEGECSQIQQMLEEEQESGQRKDRTIKEMNGKIHDLEEEIESEKASKARVERQCNDLDKELQELQERLEEAGGATAAQIDLNRRREEEINKLRTDLETSEREHGENVDALKRKINDMNTQLEEAVDAAKKSKTKTDKDRKAQQEEYDALSAAFDALQKQKAALDKTARMLDEQLGDANSRCSTMETNLRDLADKYNKLVKENNDFAQRIEDMEAKEALLNKAKKALASQVEDLQAQLESANTANTGVQTQLKNAVAEIDSMTDELEQVASEKADKERMLNLAQTEVNNLRMKTDNELIPRLEELETENRKLAAKVTEMDETNEELQSKCNNAEKTKSRLALELEDTSVELDRVKSDLGSMEKKQRKVDQMVSEWKAKYDSEVGKNESLTREIQKSSTDVMNLRNQNVEVNEELDACKRLIKQLQTEIADLSEQLEGGGKTAHEVEKMKRKLEGENEELRGQLEETEASLTLEENKTAKLSLELSQSKSDFERRMLEREDEADKDRKMLVRQMDALSHALEDETKAKADLVKARKLAEGENAGLNEDLMAAEKTIQTVNSNMAKQQKSIQELQTALDDAHRGVENLKSALLKSDKKASGLMSVKEDLEANFERAERARKQLDAERTDLQGQVSTLETQNTALESSRKRLDIECSQVKDALEELEGEKRDVEVIVQRATESNQRLQAELASEQESRNNQERACQTLTRRIVELESHLEDAEATARSSGKAKLAALEAKWRQAEADMDMETKRRVDAEKALKKAERTLKEAMFNAEEDSKTVQRQQSSMDMQNSKIKSLKRQLDDTETQISQLQSKLRKAQGEASEAEERATLAESQLSRANRSGASARNVGRMARTGSYRDRKGSASNNRFKVGEDDEEEE